jgi:hypothetical protein
MKQAKGNEEIIESHEGWVEEMAEGGEKTQDTLTADEVVGKC